MALSPEQTEALYDTLDTQGQMYLSMDLSAIKNDPKLKEIQKQLQQVRNKIEARATSLQKSAQGKRLLELSRRIQFAEELQKRLSPCTSSKNAKESLQSLSQSALHLSAPCEIFLQKENFKSLLTTINKTQALSPSELLKASREISVQILNKNFEQAARKVAALNYLVKDLSYDSNQFFAQICPKNSSICQQIAKTEYNGDLERLKTHLQQTMAKERAHLQSLKVKPQSFSELGELARCSVLKCGSQLGALNQLNRNFSPTQLVNGQDAFNLRNITNQKTTSLPLEVPPVKPSSQLLTGVTRDQFQHYRDQYSDWEENTRSQVQRALDESLSPLQSHPFFQTLSHLPSMRQGLCLGGCSVQILNNAEDQPRIQLVNSEGDSLNKNPYLLSLERDPAQFVKSNTHSTLDKLTSGLRKVSEEVMAKEDRASRLEALARLIQGNPLASVQSLVEDPRAIASFCEALKAMRDDNSWKEVLIAVGGVGAVVVGGLFGGPPGAIAAGVLVGAGSAIYEQQKAQRNFALARHYQVACLAGPETSASMSCKKYNQKTMEAQGHLLDAGLSLLTAGSLNGYKSLVKSALQSTGELAASLQVANTSKLTLTSLQKTLSPATYKDFLQKIESSNIQEVQSITTNIEELKRLYGGRADQMIERALQKICGTSGVK